MSDKLPLLIMSIFWLIWIVWGIDIWILSRRKPNQTYPAPVPDPQSDLPPGFKLQTDGDKWRVVWPNGRKCDCVQDTRGKAVAFAQVLYSRQCEDQANAQRSWRDAQ